MSSLGLPFQNTVCYWQEASYGGGESGTTLPVSCKIIDARIGVGDKHKTLRGIDHAYVCSLLEQPEDLTFHIEYIPQIGDTLIDDSVDRNSGCTLTSQAFFIGVNRLLTPAADRSYYYLAGCVPKTVNFSSSKGNEYVVSIDYSVKSVVTGTTKAHGGNLAGGDGLTGAYCAFNVGGSITKNGGAFAYVLNSVDITINHNITDRWDHDSLTKQYAVPGAMDFEGSVDISLDEGGKADFGEVLSQTSWDLIVNMGASPAPKITINNCQWKNMDIDLNISGEDIMSSVPFTGKPSSCSLIISTV